MLREYAALAIAALCPACSLILDFSDNAIPHDAAIDTPYTQAECDYKEPNDSLAMPAVLPISETGPAAICAAAGGGPEDHDFYKITVSNPALLTIEVTYMSFPSGDLDMRLYDPSGIAIATSRAFTGTEKITCPSSVPPACPALSAGDYTFEVMPAITGATNAYTFKITN